VLFKYQRLIRNIFLSISLPLLLVLFILPEKYLATTKVLIKPGRAYLNLSPTSESALNVAPSPDVLNSEIQIIRSREVLDQLAKELPFPTKAGATQAPLRNKGVPVRATSIIQISLASTNPEWAAKVVNRAAELYQEQQIKVRKTQGIEKFYDEQERRLTADLLKAEQELKAFQQSEGIVDAAKEVDQSLTGLAGAEQSLKNTESLIRETERRIAARDPVKGQQPTVSASKSITTDPVYQSIRAVD
jgi:uncharacterized protein involved in exopolysaccharide biosynthesis